MRFSRQKTNSFCYHDVITENYIFYSKSDTFVSNEHLGPLKSWFYFDRIDLFESIFLFCPNFQF